MGTLPQLSVIKGPQRDVHPQLIHRMFEQSLNRGKHYGQTALIDRCGPSSSDAAGGTEQRTDYAHLNGNANRYARCMVRTVQSATGGGGRGGGQCNGDGDWIVAVCMPPSARLVTTLLACMKAGAAYLPIDPDFPLQRIEHILNEAQPALVIHDAGYAAADTVFGGVTHLSDAELHRRSETGMYGSADLSDEETLSGDQCQLAIVLYTSGSTGVPKGVRLPHSIIQNRLQWQWEAMPFGETERVGVFKTALTFVDSVQEIWGPLLNKMAVLIIPKYITKDPERLVEILDQYKIERLVLVPTLLRALLIYLPMRNQPGLLHSLRIFICSGEPLSVTLAREFFDYFVEGKNVLCNFYGSTEIMGDVTYFVCESKRQLAELDTVPIGYPVNNTVLYVLDEEFRPVKRGQTGELFVAGLNVALGYVNGRDQFRFVENPLAMDPKYNRMYRTGDYASVHKTGALQYDGRTDSQLKIRGHRVDLSEVDKHLFGLEQLVDKGIVLCYRAGEIDQALLAFVTVREPAANSGEHPPTGVQIEAALKSKLADYMMPQVIVVEAIPLLVNGKVDRQTLLRTYENANNNDASEAALDFDYTDVPAHQRSLAKELFETVGHAIGRSARSSISLESNFYQLGGNSLNSIYTVAQLRNQGHLIGITDFITAKTLGDVLEKLSSLSEDTNIDSAASIDASDSGTDDTCDEIGTMRLHSTALQYKDKAAVIELMTRSFYEKADLEHWMKPDIHYSDYVDLLEDWYAHFVDNGLCFVVWDDADRMVGASVNTDANDEPEIEVRSKLSIVFEFLEEVEGPVRTAQLPTGKKTIFHSMMMGTSSLMNAQENISVIQHMETEVVRLAQTKQFTGILTTNTNPLTQQLGTHVFGYETLLNYQVNQYVSPDGSRPFGKAPNTQRALVQWKRIDGRTSDLN